MEQTDTHPPQGPDRDWLAEDLAARTAKRERRRQQRETDRAEAQRVRAATVPIKTDRRLNHAQRRRNR